MMTTTSKFCALLGLIAVLTGCSKSDSDSEVVYTKETGEKTKDIRDIEGNVSYEVTGGPSVPPDAKRLHEQARAKGQAGDYDGAITLLNQAIAAAPEWAYPRYDLAFTCLFKGDHAKALEEYRRVDSLEPRGFFTTKTALWTLEREQKGLFPTGTYSAYLSLEWMPAKDKSNSVERMIGRWPAFTPAWKERASLSEDNNKRREYLDKALAMDADAETHGMLILNRAALLHHDGQLQQARVMLEGIVTNKTSTVGTVALAKQVLKTLKK